ncbi:MAG: YbaB/EbfC family nucleoid-associated protein, partial [Bacilli bacterium]|nr:YbaB/EbfC family nucleoid-associated protein [Bacilli bacterium]
INMGMNPMQQMLMQAQKMQRELKKAKEELAAQEFKVTKGGIVEVVMTGDKTLKSVTIDKDAVDPENVDMIQDAVVMAVNEAIEIVDKKLEEIEERITGRAGGMGF